MYNSFEDNVNYKSFRIEFVPVVHPLDTGNMVLI